MVLNSESQALDLRLAAATSVLIVGRSREGDIAIGQGLYAEAKRFRLLDGHEGYSFSLHVFSAGKSNRCTVPQ